MVWSKLFIGWLVFFAIGVTFFPISFVIFSKFVDRGYAFAKILGLAIISYIIWILSFLPWIEFNRRNIIIIGLIFIACGIVIFLIKQKEILNFLKENWRKLIVIELIFLIVFLGYGYLRSYNPEIVGTEKPMDLMYLNGLLQTKHMPASDLWFSGKPMSYYYFGYLMVAVFGKIVSFNSAIVYNLGLISFYSLAFIGCFGVLYNLTKKLSYGLLAGIFVMVIGNFAGILELFKSGFINYNYWNPSRVIPGTINEFPYFSYLLGDLHPHLLVISLDTLMIALITQIYWLKKPLVWLIILAGLILGLIGITSFWSLPVYLLLFMIIIIKLNLQILKSILIIILSVIILTLPYYYNSASSFAGIGLVKYHSSPFSLMLIFGFFILFIITAIVFKLYHKDKQIEYLIIALASVGLFLIMICEVVYVKDYFSGIYARMNTVFKFYFEAWILLGLSSAYLVFWLKNNILKNQPAYQYLKIVFIIILLISLTYPIAGTYARTNHFQNQLSLNGQRGKNQYFINTVNWIQQNTSPNQVILEVAGKAYTDDDLLSVFAGRPTVIGWGQHEALWRGSWNEVMARESEVNQFYATINDKNAKNIIQNYHIAYVCFGPAEWSNIKETNSFSDDQLAQFKIEKLVQMQKFGSVAYQNQDYIIYRINL